MTLAVLVGMALAVSPARATLAAPSSRAIEVRNDGAEAAAVDVERTPRWLRIRPEGFVLRAGAHAVVTVRALSPAHARAGDHELVLFLRARPLGSTRIAVRMRLGVRLRVRMPGRLVHRFALRGLSVRRQPHRRVLLLGVANEGNVTEQLLGAAVMLVRRGSVVSRLRWRHARELVPGARALLAFHYRGRVRGLVTAIAAAHAAGAVTVQRRFHLRL